MTDALKPTDSLGETVRSAWTKVLSPDEVDVPFFAAGGSSMDAIRFTGLLKRALGQPIPARLLFDHPTLDDFTEALREHLGGA